MSNTTEDVNVHTYGALFTSPDAEADVLKDLKTARKTMKDVARQLRGLRRLLEEEYGETIYTKEVDILARRLDENVK
jgi:transposase